MRLDGYEIFKILSNIEEEVQQEILPSIDSVDIARDWAPR